MRLQRSIAMALAGVLLAVLPGCFDYTEEIRFDEKGVGKLSFTFDLGDLSFIEKLAAKTVKKNPINEEDMKKDLPAGVRLTEYREETKNERKIVYATYEFDDLNKLAQWKRNDKDDLIFKNFSLTKVDDTWAFNRTIRAKDPDQLENAKKHLARSKIVFKLTGPGKLVKEQSNPHRVENENTCVWEGAFPDLLEGKDGSGTVCKAQFFVGTPGWVKALVALIALSVIGGAAFAILRKKPAPPAASAPAA